MRDMLLLPAADPATRFAFRMTRQRITAFLPAGLPGAYLLLDSPAQPLYVGRSDRCLRSRLLHHPLRRRATHFTAAVTDGPRGAFMLESYWWHRYRLHGVELLNLIHPASNSAVDNTCPFCTPLPATGVA